MTAVRFKAILNDTAMNILVHTPGALEAKFTLNIFLGV